MSEPMYKPHRFTPEEELSLRAVIRDSVTIVANKIEFVDVNRFTEELDERGAYVCVEVPAETPDLAAMREIVEAAREIIDGWNGLNFEQDRVALRDALDRYDALAAPPVETPLHPDFTGGKDRSRESEFSGGYNG